MRSSMLMRVILFGIIVSFPVMAYAQEASVTGAVKDATGAVLPGVTVTAVHQATGNTFQAVTDALGIYRIPLRTGVYRITAELPGFATVIRQNVELLVGQERRVNLELGLSAVQETVTVSGEAPLIETAESSLGGNIDPRQLSELPVQGRDWKSLALLAPGNRSTEIGGDPVQYTREDNPDFNLNLDGQQVSNVIGVGGQPRYSRDAIAEFEFVSNRFDATQGRSPAAMVNAVSKSGSNTLSGVFGSYFRDSDWNAEDHVLGRKVPFEEQQVSGAFGGPIVRDRVHFFGNLEYDRLPLTTIAKTAWPGFNISLSGKDTNWMGGGRIDYQLSPGNRLMFRGERANRYTPFGTLGGDHPAGTNWTDETSYSSFVSMTTVLSNRAVNVIKGGYSRWNYVQENLTRWSNHWLANRGITSGHPRIRFRGFQIAGSIFQPRLWDQDVITLRDDFTFSYNARGRHDLKIGGEYLPTDSHTTNCVRCTGVIIARGGPVPANVEQLFPDPFNVDTWNLAAISPIVDRYELGVGEFDFPDTLHKWGAWIQDDWQISSRMTLNLGLRYDLIWNAFGQKWSYEPWVASNRPQDADNFQPRIGFTYALNDKTVFRGGGGLYYADIASAGLSWAQIPTKISLIIVQNDGRPDFAANPFNGPAPTYEEAQQRFCNVNNVPGCLLQSFEELAPPAEYAHVPKKWQTSIGAQRQLGRNSAFSADYVYARGSNEKVLQPNVNLTYDPATGVNYPFSDASRRVDPTFGIVGMDPFTGTSTYHALQSALTKRLSNGWQASLTYTLSGLWNAEAPPITGLKQVTQPVPPDLGGDRSFAVTDQRHRVVFNGIWEVGRGFQLSGLYFYGSGMRLPRIYGDDLRDLGEGFETFGMRLRPDGSIVPRNGFVGDPVHRVDVRFQQRVPLAGNVKVDGIFEVFNLFNRANYGSYDTDETSPRFGQPNYSANLAYAPRTLQLGFRLIF